ncbi:unnamed protein product [Caenorhabditis sp. 36 PRJEB53466]|nr:unnamed protein product [Caenorhabditis sp. 36 PRJEB53466]
MNRMIHTQSEPQTSFGGTSSQHMQQQQSGQHPSQNGHTAQILNRLFSSYHQDNGSFDSNLLLNGGQQKFDFNLPNLPTHPNHLMANGSLLGGNQQPAPRGTNGTTKKKKGAGPGRRPALDANGLPKDRPFVCPRQDCLKRFCRNDHLQRHMRIHTGQRLFQCRTCLRSFSRSDHLAKHERTHSSDKPYSCVSCARGFHKHEEKKKHEEKCQQKQEDRTSGRPQINLMGGQPQPIWTNQNPNSSSASASAAAAVTFGHHLYRLVDDLGRFNAGVELELDDDSLGG